jgi:acetoacetyl-CoA synthetase
MGRGAPVTDAGEVLWAPPADIWDRCLLGKFLAAQGITDHDYDTAWRWSVHDLEGFWGAVADWFQVAFHAPYERVLSDTGMPGARWFEGATLNYAEHALRHPGTVVSRGQTRGSSELQPAELRDQVARARAGLQRLGVQRGDRVAAYLPNISETLVAFLATASLGAVWSSCAPEFGTRSVVDRWQQIEPKVLLTVDGYRYGDKAVDRTAEVAAIRAALPSLAATVSVPYLGGPVPDAVDWESFISEYKPFECEAVPFDHPLYILFSSGTTGLPKPIVHGHGGIVVEHLKALALHADLGPGDRFFWFSTTGWMMWNYLVSGLLVGADIVLYDGNPGWPDLNELWRMAADSGVTWFGASAPFLLSGRKEGLRPGAEFDLSRVRAVGSTGAPLPAEGFWWVYDAVGKDLALASVSGGTDVCSAFVGAAPVLPVRAGVIPCRYLGAKVEAYDETGHPVVGRQGELVITAPMPSMPVGFWNDPDGSRYRAAYFADFPGVWRHGDWITIAEDGSSVISGRSDATLNRGGVRLGTAEFYSVVESMPEVADSLVVHIEDPEGGPGDLVLFVALAEGVVLDDGLRTRIASELRTNLSPRHVPNRMHQVPSVPRTLSGKKLEVPVKRILTGTPPDEAAARGALANPESLDAFAAFAPGPGPGPAPGPPN